ncbi:hypothetical protein K7H91_16620 [Martelella mediterranea]|uniref:hypothetical protein n=1 Tax=Martelella mediterranea TaxID=293089 RepID=UPI001E63EDC5|nr:hypothetical protein [Martelella mediterranea]MCD1635394.1 hypothetical protein [Martelella mediterranea]
MTRRRFLIKFAVLACIILAGLWGYGRILDMNAEPTYTADRLFKPYGEDVYHLAQRIERGGHISTRDVEALPGGVNKRYGDEITFLFLALQAHNLQAIDTLLADGADPYMVDRPSQRSERNFVYYLTMPGPSSGPVQGFDFENRMIESYLKHGGKANVQLLGNGGEWLIEQVGLIGNYEGVELLLKAGADPWSESDGQDTLMSSLALMSQKGALSFLNELIDQGYFKNPPLPKLQKFMNFLASYEQRKDELSREIRQIALRVLKRNPDYPPDQNTQELFGGPIPWQEAENAK